MQASKEAGEFGHAIVSNERCIRLYVSFIRKYDEEIASLVDTLHEIIDANEDTTFVRQVHLLESFKGAGFISAVTLMAEIGDFSGYSRPKQLFAFYGLDPPV